ncbi:MAG: hypothetical protein AB7U73_22705 [Pirellulales bacterium]
MDENPYEPPQKQRLPPALNQAAKTKRLRAMRHCSLLAAGIALAILLFSGDDRDVFVIVAPITAVVVVGGVLGWLTATVIGFFR